MSTWPYVYELRQEGIVLSTGHLTSERQLGVDDVVSLGSGAGRVIEVVHGFRGPARLILELEARSEP